MADEPRYKMSISLNVLQHLGVGLYSNIPAVLSEAVANAWDADAELVDISINHDEKTITITDDGDGMSIDDANKKYLHVGYNRREKDGRVTSKGRQIMGRKGIGKLSLFSIAGTVTVHSVKQGQRHGFQMTVSDIKRSRDQNQSEYFPKSMPSDRDLKKGTKIVLSDLKPQLRRSSALRKRLARRFSVIGREHEFIVQVDGKEITIEDREYQSKIQYAWIFGDYGSTAMQNVNEKNHLDAKINIDGSEVSIDGWIGTVEKPSQLKNEGENINKIVIMVRGKMAQEDILDEFEEGGIYTKYMIGEIHADFLDLDNKADITTTSRQRIIEDDTRYVALKKHVWNCLKQIQREWSEFRNAEGVKQAMVDPKIKKWYDTLQNDHKVAAKKLFGRINQLAFDDDVEGTRRYFFISGILAFESMKLRNMLDQLEAIDVASLYKFREIFLKLDDLEATSYYQITRQRLEVIEKLVAVTRDDEKEKIIQEHIFEHLWIVDPSWKRLPGTEQMESSVKKAFAELDAGLSDEQKRSRVDIKYSKIDGKHVIIELKRSSTAVNTFELASQVQKYSQAISNLLRQSDRETELVEFVCVLGKMPKGWANNPGEEKKSRDSLKPYNARIVFYNELIEDAQNAYRDYTEQTKSLRGVYDLVTSISSDDASILGP